MSKQAKLSFTKGAEGNTYISEEVDGYLVMLHSAYEEMESELETVKGKLTGERGCFDAEQGQSMGSFEEECKACLGVEIKNEQLESELAKARRTIERLEASVGEDPNLDEVKKFYETQIETFKEKANNAQGAKEEVEGEKLKLQEEVNEYLKIIEELKKMNAEVKNASEIEEFYEEKVKGFEELVAHTKEAAANLQNEKAVLLEAKQQLEAEQLKNTSDGRAKICSEMFERTIDAAQGYADEAKAKMDAMFHTTKAEQDKLLHRANVRAFHVIREAKIKADELIVNAKGKSQEILSEAKEEHGKIRELIEKSSREYVAIASLESKNEMILCGRWEDDGIRRGKKRGD